MVQNKGKLTEKIIKVPREVDEEVAKRVLGFWNVAIDKLTPEQEKYLNSWEA
jgi:adenosylhomocysteinase